jgi:hypothetical protein
MYRTPITTILFLSLVLAISHGLATYFNLYFFVWWFDTPMHILGGVLVGVVMLTFYNELCTRRIFQKKNLIAWAILVAGVLFVGVAWEYFEYAKGITFNTIGSYRLDILKDIGMDMLGGLIAGIFILHKKLITK